MQIINLYKYQRHDGGFDIGPNQPQDRDYTQMYRLVAEVGKLLTDGTDFKTPCIDVEDTAGWYEVDDTSEDDEEITAEEALEIITGGGE